MVVPYISREDVAATLASLVYSARKPDASGLQQLLLVDLLVTAPEMPATDDMRNLAVRDLLVTEITRALDEQRRVFELDALSPLSSRQQVLAQLVENVTVGTHELLTWSVLYYRYVRVDLDLSVEALAGLLAVHTRTVARYHDDGVDLLTRRLIHAEQQARRAQVERRLYAVLPYSVPARLVGRDDLLRSTEAALADMSPRHLLITGENGVGKTAFVQELVRRQIAAGNLDQLVWINRPDSAVLVRQQVAEALLREGGQVTLREYLLLYRVAVVLDGIESLAADRETFVELLRDLGAALVCLVSPVALALEGVEAYLSLPPVAFSAAEVLISEALRLQPAFNMEERRAISTDLYERFGGNPLALRLAAALWQRVEDWSSLETEVQDQLLARLVDSLSGEERRACTILALLPRLLSNDQLAQVWSITSETLRSLQRLALLEAYEDDSYRLIDAVRNYLRQQYGHNHEIRRLFDSLTSALEPADAVFEVLEQILLSGFPSVTAERRVQWIEALVPEGLRRGHWARWRAILEAYRNDVGTLAPSLRIAYGICLRRLADWEGAREVFYAVVADCGRAGRFDEQARALAEWSVLARQQGDYVQALSLINQAKRFAQRARTESLAASLALHEAQLLIQQGSAADAFRILGTLPETANRLALQSEAQLALGDLSTARALASRALRLLKGDPATEASLHSIIGRSYESAGDHQQAHSFLTNALTLFERAGDPFSLARAQTNLAAVLIPIGRYGDAERLLNTAERVQSRLGDKVGMSATRHNRTILAGYIAR